LRMRQDSRVITSTSSRFCSSVRPSYISTRIIGMVLLSFFTAGGVKPEHQLLLLFLLRLLP
jgi:hypothetical protein